MISRFATIVIPTLGLMLAALSGCAGDGVESAGADPSNPGSNSETGMESSSRDATTGRFQERVPLPASLRTATFAVG